MAADLERVELVPPDKIKGFKNIKYKNSVKEAINSLDLKKNDIAIITGSLYLVGEVLNLN